MFLRGGQSKAPRAALLGMGPQDQWLPGQRCWLCPRTAQCPGTAQCPRVLDAAALPPLLSRWSQASAGPRGVRKEGTSGDEEGGGSPWES